MLEVDGLVKAFGGFRAVDGCTLKVARGEILGLIGPNGAGKTTTMRMLTGFIPASEGRAEVAGFDVFESPMEVRRRVGYLPETPPLYRELSIGEYLRFVAEIRGISRSQQIAAVGRVMEQVGLAGWESRIVGSLSKGYRQRVGLAQAIIHDPPVLILDEPSSGLDPAQVAGMRDFVRQLAQDRTVILSTHILTEVEQLCSRVVLINGGQILADEGIDEIRRHAGGGVRYRIELGGADPESIPAQVGALAEVEQVQPLPPQDGLAVLDVRAPGDPRTAIAALATARGWSVRAMERRVPSLEDAFLALIGVER